MSTKKNKPRNPYVKAMTLHTKRQIFKHKTEPQGGATNEQKEYLSENDLLAEKDLLEAIDDELDNDIEDE